VAAIDTGEDRAHMARAVAVAERARRVSSPNPAVGCVLVRDHEIVAEAATDRVGGPHAEARALADAGERACGATAYVTLEPCAHTGRTPPCADALGAAGVARVVYGADDPNPQARGGAEVLRDAGVQVDSGAFAPWVEAQLEGFLTTVARGRPHVTLKLAHTLDGRLAPALDEPRHADGEQRRWVTGRLARRAVHRWRAAVDGVLVGSGTVLADDPRLDVRHVAAPGGQPRAIVLDGRLRTPPGATVARPGTIVLTGPDAEPADRAALEAVGVEVHAVPCGDDGHLDLPASLAALAGLGITSVLAEPGATLAGALMAAGVVDRLVCHIAPDLGAEPLTLPVPTGPGWRVERLGAAGADLVLHLLNDTKEP
jgi:diaminohydroxyphosphoribosylaminopyrimidine deaminase / 5-amino-6-(5-phosphoribosylamino)uracil reductase